MKRGKYRYNYLDYEDESILDQISRRNYPGTAIPHYKSILGEKWMKSRSYTTQKSPEKNWKFSSQTSKQYERRMKQNVI